MRRAMNGRGRRLGAIVVLGFVAATAALGAGGLASATAKTPAKQRDAVPPNIVLILTDDQRFDTLWSMPQVQSRLVQHGVTFTKAYVVNSLCCPSRTSILTGLYSHHTGVWRNYPPFSAADFDPSSTIATWLDPTYDTGLFGKYLNGYRGTVIPPGWDSFNAINKGSSDVAYYNYSLNENGTTHKFGTNPIDYSTNVLARRATSFIDNASGPFFLYFAPSAPHLPAVPAPGDERLFSHLAPLRPPSYNEADLSDKPAWVTAQAGPRFSAAKRQKIDQWRIDQYRSLQGVDSAVAGIVNAVKARGELANTMFVFMSDNGYMLGEHRLTQKAAAYEESINVPMVIRYDPLTASVPGGRVDDTHFALNIDLAPTFAAAAGVTPGLSPDGVSLLPLLDQTETSWRTDFLVEHLDEGMLPTYCAVRSQTEMYAWYSTKEQELYDLTTDPYEMTNVASNPAYAGDVAAMQARMDELCNPAPPDDTFTLPP